MYELIRVGNDKLIGEIIRLEGDSATIQVRSLICVLLLLRSSVQAGAEFLLGSSTALRAHSALGCTVAQSPCPGPGQWLAEPVKGELTVSCDVKLRQAR